MQVHVLGTVEVVGPNGLVTLRGRLGCVVAALVARRGRPVPAEVLADDVFGDDAAGSAPSTIHGYVYRVRARVPGLVESTAAGYRLGAGVEVDADEFTARSRSGHVARSAGDLAAACTWLDAALTLWRGPAFADYCDRDFALAEAVSLEEMRRSTEDARLEILAETEPVVEVIAELERAVTAEPSRERRWALLIDALARADRLGDATRAAERYRRFMRDEFGLRPSSEFEALALPGTLNRPDPTSRLVVRGPSDEVERVVTEARSALHAVPVVPASVAAEAALAAGNRLIALGALDAADAWLGEAIAVLASEDPRWVASAHLTRADIRAHRESGDWLESVLAAARLAAHLDDTHLLVEAALLNPGGTATGSAARVALLRDVLDRVAPDDPQRPLLLAQLGCETAPPYEQADRVAMTDEALARARRSGDETSRALVIASLLNDSGRFLAPNERGSLAAELEMLATRLGRGDASWLAAAHCYWSAVQRALPADASQALGAVVKREAARRELPAVHRTVPLLRSIDAFIAGRLDEADAFLDAAGEGAAGRHDALGVAAANRQGVLLRLRREQGRLSELLPMLSGDLGGFAALLAPSALALVCAELGDREGAGVALARCRADARCPPLYLPHVWSVRVEAAALAGEADRAVADAKRLEPYAGQVLCGTRGCDGAVDRFLGIAAASAGDRERADGLFTCALTIHRQLGSPTFVARTLHDRARWLGDEDAGAAACSLARRHRLPGLAEADASVA